MFGKYLTTCLSTTADDTSVMAIMTKNGKDASAAWNSESAGRVKSWPQSAFEAEKAMKRADFSAKAKLTVPNRVSWRYVGSCRND